MFVSNFDQERNIISGLTECDYQVKLIVHQSNLFGDKVNKGRLELENVIITEVYIKHVANSYKPYIIYCNTSDLSRFIVCSDHWLQKYKDSIEDLKILYKKPPKRLNSSI